MQKFGTIPFRIRDGRFELLFITSKRRRRWIFPKGNLKKGEAHKDAALRESFEEAGVTGKLFHKLPLMSYKPGQEFFEKRTNVVVYYPMFVSTSSQHWPEHNERKRFWVELSRAHLVTEKPRTIDLIRQFEVITFWLEPEISKLKEVQNISPQDVVKTNKEPILQSA